MFLRPTIEDVREALMPLAGIPRPYGDNEGDPINGDTVFPYLAPAHQAAVLQAERVCIDYTRTPDGLPDRRSISHMIRSGFPTHLDPYQYSSDKLVGDVAIGDWSLDISDQISESDDAY